ncbi:MAG: four helix bundle protein [Tannerellaceae bacterium]|jgi:four helix bundle protein|nr:four helix bundle protein [Tannerellaceae bacterium]
MGTHKDLIVWQKGIELVKEVYHVTQSYPQEELWGLTSQIRRCVVSIPSNIAEGCGRHSDKELIRFLYIALGSAAELETQLIISRELSFLSPDKFDNISSLNSEIIRMVTALLKQVKNKPGTNS